VNAMTRMRTARRTAVKVVGSLGVVTAATAVAGLGTFGSFSDSTTPGVVPVQTGVVSIDLAATDGGAAVPLTFGSIVPGASVTHAVDLVNDGDSALSSVGLATVATASSILDTDTVDGLQTTVTSCSVAWSEDWSCAGDARTLLAAGPVVRSGPLASPRSLVPGVTDHLAVTVVLPATAGDAFKQQASDLSLVFTAVQREGTAR
jgi:spore coat-associated protein N